VDVKTFLDKTEIKGPVVYSFFRVIDEKQVYLYIGSTTDLKRRIIEHHVIGRVFELRNDIEFDVKSFPVIAEAREFERAQISEHKPLYNSRGKGKRLDLELFDILIEQAEERLKIMSFNTPWLRVGG
jgi:GIY-YIG catalytic domain